MIKRFVLDIDGCISHPFVTPDWETLSEIRELNRKSREVEEIPSLTLCTGRPLPYAEAVAQWLDIRLPFAFESALLYHPTLQRIETEHGPWPVNGDEEGSVEGKPGNTPDRFPGLETQIVAFRNWLNESLLPRYPGAIPEFTKIIDAGVISADRKVIDQIHREILQAREELFPELEVHRTEVSVNTLPPGSNKLTGFGLISRTHEVSLSEMAYIGDSEADLGPLKSVAMPFAPSNAIESVREAAEALEGETSQAVLEAYRQIIERNRSGG